MDFTTTEAAQDLGGLVDTIVDAVCTPEHQRELDGLDQRFDRELWRKLIEADVLSAAAPQSVGGGGFGVLEQVAVLTELGRALAAVPSTTRFIDGTGPVWSGSLFPFLFITIACGRLPGDIRSLRALMPSRW